MARRLDRIEKEMGYCEIKLEKERRLRKQIAFLREDIEALEQLIRQCAGGGRSPGASGQKGSNPRGDVESARRASREEFMATGLQDIIQDERDILARELEGLAGRLKTFSGFETKRTVLEEEKRNALDGLAPAHSVKLRRINDDLKKVERQWNSLTEDLLNLDEGLFFLERNLDYLRSARTFLIAARGNFDVDSWVQHGYLADLFRHSPLARAKEMADGADRNLKLAQKELVCVSNVRIRADAFQRVLWALMAAIFDDLHTEGKIYGSLQTVEAALAGNISLVEQVRARREQLSARLSETEKLRTQMFVRLGAERRGRLVG